MKHIVFAIGLILLVGCASASTYCNPSVSICEAGYTTTPDTYVNESGSIFDMFENFVGEIDIGDIPVISDIIEPQETKMVYTEQPIIPIPTQNPQPPEIGSVVGVNSDDEKSSILISIVGDGVLDIGSLSFNNPDSDKSYSVVSSNKYTEQFAKGTPVETTIHKTIVEVEELNPYDSNETQFAITYTDQNGIGHIVRGNTA